MPGCANPWISIPHGKPEANRAAILYALSTSGLQQAFSQGSEAREKQVRRGRAVRVDATIGHWYIMAGLPAGTCNRAKLCNLVTGM